MSGSIGIQGGSAQRWYSGKMLVCTAVLVAAALGLRPGMSHLADAMRKVGLPVRKPLAKLDVSTMERFERSAAPVGISGTMAELGTNEYAFINFSEKQDPRAVLTLGLTYYCDPQDKVPHTPEVCYRHSGYLVKEISSCSLTPKGSAPVPATTVVMAGKDYDLVVVYVFHANGAFYRTRNQVRWVVLRPGDRHVYFSKMEASSFIRHDDDPAPAIARCRDLLAEVIPVLVADHLPGMPSAESK